MPALSNPRHERFVQALAKGESQASAYVSAGYKPSRSAAARLFADVSICARLEEIQGRVAQRTELTVATITEKLLAIAETAESKSEAPMLNVARAAYMDAAKLNGLVIDRAEVKTEVEVTDARERLARIVAGNAAATAAVGGAGKPH